MGWRERRKDMERMVRNSKSSSSGERARCVQTYLGEYLVVMLHTNELTHTDRESRTDQSTSEYSAIHQLLTLQLL